MIMKLISFCKFSGKWKLFFDSELHDFGGAVIFKGNLNKNDLAKVIHMSDPFTTEIL